MDIDISTDKIKTYLFPCFLDYGKNIVIQFIALDSDILSGKVNIDRTTLVIMI